MPVRENFIQAVANMENALTNALNASGNAAPNDLERLLKLVIKKEIVLEFLLEEFPDLCSLTTNTFTNITPTIIPAEGTSGSAAPYPSSIDVSGLTGAIQKVTVTFNDLSHTFPSDISAMLVGPNGQDTILMSAAGSGFNINNVTLTFDDDAPTPLPSAQITSGTYQPSNYGIFNPYPSPAPAPSGNTQLSVYNDTDPNGTWNLYIIDQFGGDSGRMVGGWELNITSCEPSTNATNNIQQSNKKNESSQITQKAEVRTLTEEEKIQKRVKLEAIKKMQKG